MRMCGHDLGVSRDGWTSQNRGPLRVLGKSQYLGIWIQTLLLLAVTSKTTTELVLDFNFLTFKVVLVGYMILEGPFQL